MNQKISFPKWIEKYLIKSSIDTATLSFNIKKIMRQDIQKEFQLKKMESEFGQRYKTDKLALDYKNCINNIN